jgi:glucose-1-phosphate thymidylyltransferase
MKGVILAAGKGTRLYPITSCISKQLLPIYNKPMIYYPLSVLMFAGIKEVLIVTSEKDKKFFKRLFSDGDSIGISIRYEVQKEPKGIADALLVAEDFIGDDNVCLVLGDNIFYGNEMPDLLRKSKKSIVEKEAKAIVFGYPVKNPEHYGVAEYNKEGYVTHLEEKPSQPRTDCAVTGIYMYDNTCIDKIKTLNPSKRNELEITDLNKKYLEKNELKIELLGRGHAWFDTGTFESFYESSNFVRSVENRQGLMIANIHEIAYRCKYITPEKLKKFIDQCGNNDYRNYLEKLLRENK